MDATSWAMPLIRSFLSNSLPIECLLRLWDTYIAKADVSSIICSIDVYIGDIILFP